MIVSLGRVDVGYFVYFLMLAILKSWVEHTLVSCRVCDQAPNQIFALQSAVQSLEQHCFSAHPKNTCVAVEYMLCLVAQSCCTFCGPIDCSPPGSSSMGFSRQECGVGCHALLQGISPTEGSNPGLPHCRWILYHLSHQGSLYMFSVEV